jgi:hypothetical protein
MAARVKGGRKGGIKERKKNADEKRRQGEEKVRRNPRPSK